MHVASSQQRCADLAVLVGAGQAHVIWDAQQWVSTRQQHLHSTTATTHTQEGKHLSRQRTDLGQPTTTQYEGA
jgi:DNA-binding transcriptional regulator/RsmH inhibitor MraZ